MTPREQAAAFIDQAQAAGLSLQNRAAWELRLQGLFEEPETLAVVADNERRRYEELLDFCEAELDWLYFREETFNDSISGRNAIRLREFLNSHPSKPEAPAAILAARDARVHSEGRKAGLLEAAEKLSVLATEPWYLMQAMDHRSVSLQRCDRIAECAGQLRQMAEAVPNA